MTTYDFESGSPGNAASTANTGAITVVAGGGHAITISTSNAISGAQSLQFTAGNTTAALYTEYAAESGTTNSIYLPVYLSSDGYAVDTTLWQIFAADNTTVVGRLAIRQSDSRLAFTDQGTAHTLVINSNVSAQFGTMVAIRLQLDQSAGTVAARYYTNPIAAVGTYTNDVSASSHTLGTGGFGKTRLGINSTQSSLGANGRTTRYDYYTVQTGTSWIAPPAAPTAPTADAGADQYGQAGTTFTLTGSGTPGTSGGSINSYQWAFNSKSDPSMSTPTITTPSAATTTVTGLEPGFYRFVLMVGQTGGGLFSSTDLVTVWVHPPSGVPVKPYTITKATGITREGAATTDIIAITDGDPTTLLKWPDPPSGELITIVWNPCGPSNPQFAFDLGKTGSGTINATINHYLEDGTTLVDGPYTTALSTAVTTVQAGLDAGGVAAIGSTLANRRQLVTKISAS